MARVRIEYPDKTLFETTLAVRITDLNYGGHVGNDTLLSYLQEARTTLLREWGYPGETEGIEGVGFIMADVAVSYKAELFYGDTLRIQMAAQDLSRSGFDWVYRVTRQGDNTLVALAKTGMVCFDYSERKIAGLPAAFKARLEGVD